MSLRTLTIEVRVDFDTEHKWDLFLRMAMGHAKALKTDAELLADKRKPDIALSTSDMIAGADEISMFKFDDA